MKTITAIIARRVIDMKNTVKIIAAILAFTMFTSCGQLEDTSKAETKATSATATTTTVGTWKPSFENATTFTTTTSVTTTTTSQTTTTKTTTTKKVATTVQNNSNNGNGGVAYYPSQDNQPSYNKNNGDNDYSYEQPQQTEQHRQTTTKKEEQPSKPSGNKITQADIDAMKKELQEYSNSKADFIRENYTEFDGYGVEYNTLEEFFEMSVNKKTPTNAGYNDEYTIYFDEKNIEGITKSFKEDIDYIYRRTPNTHIVIYIETCSSYWAVYLLN